MRIRSKNADETHFVINMDNDRTVIFRSQEHVRYADVASGNEGITMMVWITGGKDAHVEVPMLVFINEKCSYPIQGVPDSVPGACYGSGKEDGCIKAYFRNGYLSQGQFANIRGGLEAKFYNVDKFKRATTKPTYKTNC